MTIKCPKCGKELPDESQFCLECGTRISNPAASRNLSIFSNGKIFLALIFIVLIIGGILIFAGGGDHSNDVNDKVDKEAREFDFIIKEIDAYDNVYDGKTSYTYYLYALFNKVPSNKDGYLLKTTYYDKNDTELGSEIETLSSAYFDSDYGNYVGYYTSYKYIDVDHAKLQVIKDDRVIKESEAKLDKNKIDFEQQKTNK